MRTAAGEPFWFNEISGSTSRTAPALLRPKEDQGPSQKPAARAGLPSQEPGFWQAKGRRDEHTVARAEVPRRSSERRGEHTVARAEVPRRSSEVIQRARPTASGGSGGDYSELMLAATRAAAAAAAAGDTRGRELAERAAVLAQQRELAQTLLASLSELRSI